MSKSKTELYNYLKNDLDFLSVYKKAFKTSRGYKTRLKFCIDNCLSKDIKPAYLLDKKYLDISYFITSTGEIINVDEIYFSWRDYFV